MKRLIILAMILSLAIISNAYAAATEAINPEAEPITIYGKVNAGTISTFSKKEVVVTTLATDLAVAGTSTVYTLQMPISNHDKFAIGYKAISATSEPQITLQLEQSFIVAGTESTANLNFVVPDGVSDIATDLSSETQHYVSSTPLFAPYMRLKIIGSGTNPGDTTVTIKVSHQNSL